MNFSLKQICLILIVILAAPTLFAAEKRQDNNGATMAKEQKSDAENQELSNQEIAYLKALKQGKDGIEIAAKLFDGGFDVNRRMIVKDDFCTFLYNSTPLIEATRSGNLEMVELLISRKANVNDPKKSANNESIYGTAFSEVFGSSGGSKIIAALLLKAGATRPKDLKFNARLVRAEKESSVFAQALAKYAPLSLEEREQVAEQEAEEAINRRHPIFRRFEYAPDINARRQLQAEEDESEYHWRLKQLASEDLEKD